MLKIKYKVLKHAENLPAMQYQTRGSSGLDLYSANRKSIDFSSLERISVPTGICLSIPAGYEAQIRPRSGLFIKNGISANFGTIDSDYRGEIKVILINLGQESFKVEKGLRIAQMVVCPIVQAQLKEVDDLKEPERGKGGFGSTGAK